MTAIQKGESPVGAGLFAEVTSIYPGHQSTSRSGIPKAPALAQWDSAAGWILTAPGCPLCGEKHVFNGGHGVRPAYGAHDVPCGAGAVQLCRVDVSAWARAICASEAAILDAVHQLSSITDVDRRFKLRPGTAMAAMVDAMEVQP